MIIVNLQAAAPSVGDRINLDFFIDNGDAAYGSDVFTVEDGQVVRISFDTLGAMLGIDMEDFVTSDLRITEDNGYFWEGQIPVFGNIVAYLT